MHTRAPYNRVSVGSEMDCGGKRVVFEYATKLLSRFFSVYPLLFYFLSSKEFFGKDRPRQLALNKSITAYQLRNLAHDTEYVISLYVLFGSVEGPGITTSARTCEYRQDVQVATTAHNPCVSGSTSCIPTKALHCTSCTPLPSSSSRVRGTMVVVVLCPANLLCLVGETVNPKGSRFSAWESSGANWSPCVLMCCRLGHSFRYELPKLLTELPGIPKSRPMAKVFQIVKEASWKRDETWVNSAVGSHRERNILMWSFLPGDKGCPLPQRRGDSKELCWKIRLPGQEAADANSSCKIGKDDGLVDGQSLSLRVKILGCCILREGRQQC